MKNCIDLIRYAVATSVFLSATALGNDGDILPEPSHPDYQMNLDLYQALEAACGIGRTDNLSGTGNNTSISGILIAPNMVLTANHGITGSAFSNRDTQLEYNVFDDPAAMIDSNGDPKYTVRFRLNPNGSVGTLAGGGTTFFQVPVKRVLFPASFTGSNNESRAEFDVAILVLADGPSDTGIWSNGWITHITPMAIPPIQLTSRMEFSGGIASYGPIPDHNDQHCCDRGILRYRAFDTFPFSIHNEDLPSDGSLTDDQFYFDRTGEYYKIMSTDDPTWAVGNTRPGHPTAPIDGAIGIGDSGGVFVIAAENGDIIPIWGVKTGGGAIYITDFYNSLTWQHHFGGPNPPYGTPDLITPSVFDLVEYAAPINSIFDEPNWAITAADAIAMASGSTSPSLPGIDWNNDGQIDLNDFKSYARELETALNPYFSSPLLPLPIGNEDVNNDGRFNIMDSAALTAMIGLSTPEALVHDYDGSGIIDQADVSLIDQVLGTRGAPQGFTPGPLLFDHGVLGDLDRDGDIDSADVTLAINFDYANGFDNTTADDALYDVIFDANLDQVIDNYDRQVIAGAMIPVSIGVDSRSGVNAQDNITPDWQRSLYDARRTMSAYGKYMSSSTASQHDIGPGFDLVSDEWTLGASHIPPSSAQVMSPTGGVPSIHNGYITMADIQYLLSSWRDSDVGTSVQTGALLDFWFLDVNYDGRTNIKDLRFLHDNFNGTTSGIADWDYNNNGIYDEIDTLGWFDIYHIGSVFGQGFIGDYNASASPLCECVITPEIILKNLVFCEDVPVLDCNTQQPVPMTDPGADCVDLAEMITAGFSTLFDSGYQYGDASFVIQLDADLDGDNDQDDLREILYLLQPGDITFDGVVDVNDVNDFIVRFPAANGSSAGDPNYDIDLDINRDGDINFFDSSTLFGHSQSPNCN